MCSFTISQAPVASAECLRSAPSSLAHDEAVRMCTDIPSAAAHSTSSHALLCRTILPRDWSASDAATLCEGRGVTTSNPTASRNSSNAATAASSSRRQTEAAVRCAVETSSFSASSSTAQKLRLTHAQVSHSLTVPLLLSLTTIPTLPLTHYVFLWCHNTIIQQQQAARLCFTEGEKGMVLACYRAAAAPGLSPSSPLLSPALVAGLCAGATTSAPGTCLHKYATY